MTSPDAGPVLELIDAFRRSKTMFTALRMGIFDRLESGPQSAEQLSAWSGANPDALQRLLEACAGLGLLEARAGAFRNADVASAYLTAASPHSLAGYIRYSDAVLYPLWAHLDDAVREGTHRWRQTFQLDSGALFDRFFDTPESMRTFLMGMHGFGMLSSPAAVRAFDLTRFTRMVDLGGATGHLAMAACERYPDLRAVLFDLPRVVEFAAPLLAGRVECVAGDFFRDPLPEGDLYAAGRILHDWDAAKIERLLARIMEKLPPGGGLLIAERLLDEDRLGPAGAQMQSLNMLVVTEGRERTLTEYRGLLMRAGFASVEGVRTGQPLDAILAIR